MEINKCTMYVHCTLYSDSLHVEPSLEIRLFEIVAPLVENYTVKKIVIDFPISSRDVTNQTLPGREKSNYSCQGEFG